MPRSIASLPSVLLLAAGLLACGASGEKASSAPAQNTDAAYALGLMAEHSLKLMQLSPEERAEFERGMRDYRNGSPRVPLLDEIPRVQAFQGERASAAMERARAEAAQFLEDAAKEPEAQQLPSGIVLRVLEKGEGAVPTSADRAIVRAEGTLPDGLLFFSSKQAGKPFAVEMATGIPCFTEPLALLKKGSRARITCPPQSGYAAQDRPVLVPPGSALRFELEVVDVKPNLPRMHER